MNNYKEIFGEKYDKLSSKKGKYKVIEYWSNGNIKHEEYRINNKIHREDGPATTSYHENGNVYYKDYFINNKLHREDGPAVTWYYINGNIESRYYLCNKNFTKEQYYSPKIQAILDIAKMMNTWKSKINFIKLSLNKELYERL